MSFTSDEDNNDEKALLGLVMDQEKRKEAAKAEKKEEKSKKNEKVEVNFNDDALQGFNTKSKNQLIS